MNKPFYVLLFLVLGFFYSYGQSDLDSIWKKLQNSHEDTSKVNSLNKLSRDYFDNSNYEKGILIGKRSLTLAEKLKFRKGEAQALNNIGISYYKLSAYDKALDYNLQALAIRIELGNKKDISASYNNIGNVYEDKADYDLALEYKTKALRLKEGIGDKKGIAVSCNGIANIYWSLEDYSKALEYCFRALKLNKEINSQSEIAHAYITASNIYREIKKYSLSNEYAQKALLLSDSLGDIDKLLNANGILYKNYLTLKDPAKALFHYEKYIELKDSIYNAERAINMAEEESKMEFAKKEQELKFKQEKKDALAFEESKRQNIIIWSVIGGLLLVVIFSIFIFNRWRVTQKQKGIIEIQKAEVERSKIIIEEHNKGITDSIHYASRIQRALLTSDDYISKHLKDFFILFQPKDIVSGDFYWAFNAPPRPASLERDDGSELGEADLFFIACCDCTGHGVPGAFMSLLNISFLNESVLKQELRDPEKIFNSVRTSVVKALNPDGKSEAKDGMDAVLCGIDLKNNVLHAACANNPVWLVRNGAIEELKPDKMPVGLHDNMATLFSKQSVQLQKGDAVYLFTDGYADQFGGPRNKKFRYKQLKEIMLRNTAKPMSTQRTMLEKELKDWKGDNEQVDDILVIGIRI